MQDSSILRPVSGPLHAAWQPPEPLAETDLALIHALQVWPRAPWRAIAAALGVDPATATRRWQRLVDDRLAWLVVRPSAQQLAPDRDAVLIRLACRPGSAAAVATGIAEREDALAVDVLAGVDAVAAILVGRGLAPLHGEVERLGAQHPDVTAARTAFLSAVHREDAQWRLQVLSPAQQAHLARPHAITADHARPPRPEVIADLTAALADDVRMSLADLGGRLGTSEVTARRLLDRALRTQSIRLGCDVVAPAVGAGRAVLLEVEADDPHAAGRAIAVLPPVLRCATIVGPANLMLVVRFASLTGLARFESAAAALAPGWRVRDRATVTHAVKRQGRLLAADGRVRGH